MNGQQEVQADARTHALECARAPIETHTHIHACTTHSHGESKAQGHYLNFAFEPEVVTRFQHMPLHSSNPPHAAGTTYSASNTLQQHFKLTTGHRFSDCAFVCGNSESSMATSGPIAHTTLNLLILRSFALSFFVRHLMRTPEFPKGET